LAILLIALYGKIMYKMKTLDYVGILCVLGMGRGCPQEGGGTYRLCCRGGGGMQTYTAAALNY
jgi:hypothetical protein